MSPLPYAHLVTLFLEHFGIDLDDEIIIPIKRSFKIDAFVLASFRYTKTLDNQWVHKLDYRAPHPTDDSTPSPPLQDSSALLSDVLNEIRDLRVHVGKQFESFDARLTSIEDALSRRPA